MAHPSCALTNARQPHASRHWARYGVKFEYATSDVAGVTGATQVERVIEYVTAASNVAGARQGVQAGRDPSVTVLFPPAMPHPRLYIAFLNTPLGEMVAAASDRALCLLEYTDRRMLPTQLKRLSTRYGEPTEGTNSLLVQTQNELDEYFSGTLRRFTVALDPVGTAFQHKVWQILTGIPYGSTRSYGEQAILVGQPTATRAVARANGDNPIAIVVPCHRVIGADGNLTGYGGGLWRKRWLLDHERGGTLPL